jgi:enterochelin esterase-like enzyme
MNTEPGAVSPRVSETVCRAFDTGGAEAVLALARASRGPIVEPAADAGRCDVTFVLADRRDAPRQVGLFCPALPSGFARLRRLGLGIFAGTFGLPRASRVTYHFCVDPPDELDDHSLVRLARSPAGRRLDRLNPSYDQVHIRGLRIRILESLLTLPGARPAPPAGPLPGVARGSFEELTIHSRALSRRKEGWVYRSAGHADPRAPHQVILMLQGNEEWQNVAFLDNLAVSIHVGPFLAILFKERSFTAKMRDFARGPAHIRFIVDELWPELERRASLREGAAVAGFSAGGAAAAALASEEPGLFPRLALISAALHLTGDMDVRQAGGPSPRLVRRFEGARPIAPPAAAPAAALTGARRAYLAAGWYEDAWDPGIYAGTSALASLLRRQGVTVRFDNGPTGHDSISARAYLADGLAWLFASG